MVTGIRGRNSAIKNGVDTYTWSALCDLPGLGMVGFSCIVDQGTLRGILASKQCPDDVEPQLALLTFIRLSTMWLLSSGAVISYQVLLYYTVLFSSVSYCACLPMVQHCITRLHWSGWQVLDDPVLYYGSSTFDPRLLTCLNANQCCQAAMVGWSFTSALLYFILTDIWVKSTEEENYNNRYHQVR